MARIYDNIETKFTEGLQGIITNVGVKRVDFCVGYFNLRGWNLVVEQAIPQSFLFVSSWLFYKALKGVFLGKRLSMLQGFLGEQGSSSFALAISSNRTYILISKSIDAKGESNSVSTLMIGVLHGKTSFLSRHEIPQIKSLTNCRSFGVKKRTRAESLKCLDRYINLP